MNPVPPKEELPEKELEDTMMGLEDDEDDNDEDEIISLPYDDDEIVDVEADVNDSDK